MEAKKKKLSDEYWQGANGDEQPKILQLFSKKFEYSQHAHWSLKSWSTFYTSTTATRQIATRSAAENAPGRLDTLNFDLICSHGKDVRSDVLSSTHTSLGKDTEFGRQLDSYHCEANNLQKLQNEQIQQADSAPFCKGTFQLENTHLTADNQLDDKQGWISVHHQLQFPNEKKGAKTRESNNESKGRQNVGKHDYISHHHQPTRLKQLELVKITLPSPWCCETLMTMKEELNKLKDQLSDKEMKEWHQHTSSTNPAGKVVSEVKKLYNLELCTQAWCKFQEILASFDIVPRSYSELHARFNSIHLCEAPGAFITSLNHYLVTQDFDIKRGWKWLGTTLNPYYEGNDTGRMISDDRFIRNTLCNWFFGRDNSGDLMLQDNMLALMDHAQLMGDIHLVTADGSIDCQGNPAEQEMIVSRLHHCEVLASCLLLAPGGTLVIKLFTMLEASSVALLYFLNCVFEKVTVCKPATSKSGNSEVYAVCSGYTAALTRGVLFSLFAAVCASGDPHIVLLPKDEIPEDFLAEHIRCCRYFCQLQSTTISNNLDLYEQVTIEETVKSKLNRLQDLCIDHFVKVCAMKRISSSEWIVPNSFSKYNFTHFSMHRATSDQMNHILNMSKMGPQGYGSSFKSVDWRRRQGTFQQRQQLHLSPWHEKLSQMQDYAVEDSCFWTLRCRHQLDEEYMREWKLQTGRKFDVVESSVFCDGKLLGDLKLILQHAQVKFHQQKVIASHSNAMLVGACHLLQDKHFLGGTYHLPLSGSLTSFWLANSPDLATLSLQRLSSVGDLVALPNTGPIGLVVDVTNCHVEGAKEELETQARLVEIVLAMCSYIQKGSTLVLIMPAALTRLSAGIIYILASLFRETIFCAKRKSTFLHHTMCFNDLGDPPYTLLQLLESLRHSFASSQQQPSTLCSKGQNFAIVDEKEDAGIMRKSKTTFSLQTHKELERQKTSAVSFSGTCIQPGFLESSEMSVGNSTSEHTSVTKQRSSAEGQSESEQKVSLDMRRISESSSRSFMSLEVESSCVNVKCEASGGLVAEHSVKGGDEQIRGAKVASKKTLRAISDAAIYWSVRESGDADDDDLCPSPRRMSIEEGGDQNCSNYKSQAQELNKSKNVITPLSEGSNSQSMNTHTCPCSEVCLCSSSYDGEALVLIREDTVTVLGYGQAANATNLQTLCPLHPSNSESGMGNAVSNSPCIKSNHVAVLSHSDKGTVDKNSRKMCDSDLGRTTTSSFDTTSIAAFSGEGNKVVSVDIAGNFVLPERSESKVIVQVPLEVVPVLELISDGVFYRFLKACNQYTVSNFVATLKAAELGLYNLGHS